MSPRLVVFAVAFSCFSPGLAQERITTFILIRHADKVADGSKDPNLSEEGKRRAENLISFFKNTALQAIYSTSFIRTRDTVSPLAKSKSLLISEYEAFNPEEIDKILKDHYGGTVLMCGHSNNIPWIANYLTGTDALNNFNDSDYTNVLIIAVAVKGKVSSMTRLNY
jgi:2,3-bisphosphoglycerate-dependent phosphoglycerate mutase